MVKSLKYDYYDKAFEDGMRYILMVLRNRVNLGSEKMVSVGFHVLDQYKTLKKELP